jgi:hypothetical protein
MKHGKERTNNNSVAKYEQRRERPSTPFNAHSTYHHPAMSLREEPPHRESANSVVYVDKDAPMIVVIKPRL